jgi:hypothetical protein
VSRIFDLQSSSHSAQTAKMDMEKANYQRHYENMEKADYPRHLEEGLLVASDGSDAPMVVSELPQAVHAGRMPERTGSARRDGQICPMGTEALEHAPKKDNMDNDTEGRSSVKSPKTVVVKRRTAWIALAVLLVVIAAVVGGAVGGTRKSKKSSEVLQTNSPTRFVTSLILHPHD